MPTRPKKGGGSNQDTTGDAARGGQKAVYGSSRTADGARGTGGAGDGPAEQAPTDQREQQER